MEMNREMIAESLRSLRGERTHKEVADAVGITPMAISQYEQGERIPNDAIKIRLAAYFGKSVEDIFFATKVIKMNTEA